MVWQSRGMGILLIAACAAGLLGAAVSTASADEADQEIIQMVIDALTSSDPTMQTGAIAIVREIPGAAVTQALAKELPNLGPAVQVQLLSALADRGDPLALPAVIEAGKSSEESVRIAAVRTIGQIGGASSVPLLAERAAASKGAEQRAARESLFRLRGAEVDAAILKNLPSAAPQVKAELIGAVGERNIAAAVEMLLKTAREDDRRVRQESFRILRVVARPEDMPALVRLVLDVQSDADRTEAERMVASVAQKIEDRNRRAAAVLAVLPNVKDTPNRASLLRVLGRIGDDSALPTLRTALGSREADIHDAAIRALSDWPTSEPVPDLLKVAQTADTPRYRILALRGFVRLLGLESARPAEETVDLYRKAMELAGEAAEKRRVLSGLASTMSLAALNMAAEYLDDLALHREAELAAVRIAQGIHGTHPQRTKEVMEKVSQATKQDALRQQAREILDQIERFDDYIVAWRVCGPYMQDNASASELFDSPFGPEVEGQEVSWRPIAAGTHPQQPWLVELDKDPSLAGNNRVAYLYTRVSSPREQKARLELGSDDGVKVWLNGRLVHANNVERPAAPGQDRADVTLIEGQNLVLVKLTQAGGQWALCLRFRDADGGRLDGLKIEP